jgi:poly(3-hydroxybutyrate) depolymerase
MRPSISSAYLVATLVVVSAAGCGNSAASSPAADGAAGGAAGAGGATEAGASEAAAGPRLSAGCGSMLSVSDTSNAWTKHDIGLPAGSVDAAFIAAHPPNAGSQYDWTHRNYFLKLPAGYDGTTPFPVTIAGTACAGSETVGANGEYSVPADTMNVESGAIKISQSYVVSDTVSSCVGFADDFTNSPEPAYIHAVIAEVEANYCVDTSRVFINGFDAGAFQAGTAGCTNSSELRAYGVQIGGGLRLHHAPCEDHPIAAMFVVGNQDTAEPIGPLAMPQNDSNGSAPARDELLARNGCVGTNTAPWNSNYPKCVTYTGCPTAYPVVWCPLDVPHIGGAAGSDAALVPMYRLQGLWDFYMSLPAL